MSQLPGRIEVQGLWKRYCRSFRRSLWYGVQDLAWELGGRSKEESGLRPDEFWALSDLSFQVGSGESLGLIGRNGAGKTTLLKLINGLIKPSRGRIEVTGSVRALIALGAGFNPVLTGRENVKVAGAILGYSEREIDERFDEIVAFSDLGGFIDAPVQSYSSGMLARLGFSVAVHTQPDILLVDEVLAVGDLNFAIKCYQKISEFRDRGGLIVLVSHSPYSIRTNCEKALWIERGTLQALGPVHEVCEAYERFVSEEQATQHGGERYLHDALKSVEVHYPPVVHNGGPLRLELRLYAARLIYHPIIIVSFSSVTGQNLTSAVSPPDSLPGSIPPGSTEVSIRYEHFPLMPGTYYANFVIAEKYVNNQLAALINCYRVEVRAETSNYGAGVFSLEPTWERPV